MDTTVLQLSDNARSDQEEVNSQQSKSKVDSVFNENVKDRKWYKIEDDHEDYV